MENIKKFVEQVVEVARELFRKASADIKISVETVVKANDVIMTGIKFYDGIPDENGAFCEPVIYVDSWYYASLEGLTDAEECAEYIVSMYMTYGLPKIEFDTTEALEWDRIKDRIFPRFTNRNYSKKFLEDKPFRSFSEDLAIMYFARLEEPDPWSQFDAVVTENMLKSYGITEDELYTQAMKNLEREPYKLENLSDLMRSMVADYYARFNIPDNDPIIDKAMAEMFNGKEDIVMYVLSNESCIYGAVEMLNPKALHEAADILGNEFYLIPSSVHEMLLMSTETIPEREYVRAMIGNVNRSFVLPTEVLTDNLLIYRNGNIICM